MRSPSTRSVGRATVLFFFQAEDGIRDVAVTGVQTCALPISFQKSFHQVDSLGPKGRDSFLALFAEQVNVKGGLQVKVARREVQGLLDTRSGVVKDRAQDVITLALALRAIRFSENCCDLIFVQRTHGTFRGFFRGNTQNLRSEEHTSELQSRLHLVCRLLLEKKKAAPP